MTTGLQLALAGGALVGLGVALLLWRLAPAHPDLADALHRLSPEQARRSVDPTPVVADSRQRLGVWALKRLPAAAWARTPTRELALLRIPVARFYGEKVLYAVVGLCLPPLLSALFYLLDLRLPIVIPVLATVALAAVMFWLPDVNVRDDAKKARAEFARALGAYIDLVALERHSGSGTRQAMEVAADVGDSWVFRRLGEELARSRWSGAAAVGGAARAVDRAGSAGAGRPGRHHAAVRAGGRPGVQQPAGPQRRHARGDAERRTGQGQRDRRTHVHPDEHPRRHLLGHADLPGTAPPPRRHLMPPHTQQIGSSDHPQCQVRGSSKGPL